MNGNHKITLDVAALGIAAGSIVAFLPPIAAALSILWFVIRIYEYARWVQRGRKRGEKP